MSFLKTVFWVILLIGFTIFASNNWIPVTVRLFEGWLLDTKLPALIGLSFLLGFGPLYIWHRVTRFRLNRRIATLESAARPSPLDLRQIDGAAPGVAA
jgi:hypothetical protein